MSKQIKDLNSINDINKVTRILVDSDELGSGYTTPEVLLSNVKQTAIIKPGEGYKEGEVPFTWKELSQKMKDFDISDLSVGMYKDILLTGTFYDVASNTNKVLDNIIMRMEIAGINQYYDHNTLIPNGINYYHIDFISKDVLPHNLQYNSSYTNSGGFTGSQLFNTLNGEKGIYSLLSNDLKSAIMDKYNYHEVKIGNNATGVTWKSYGKLWLPSEWEIHGSVSYAEPAQYSSKDHKQYSIFSQKPDRKVKVNVVSQNTSYWWCSSSSSGYADRFCFVDSGGGADYYSAGSACGVPVCFRIA